VQEHSDEKRQQSAMDLIQQVVAIAKSDTEPINMIRQRSIAALENINPERLIAASDCGLDLLGRELAIAKLRNLCEAAA